MKRPFPFSEFIDDVYSQLECNASDDYKSKYIVYTYHPEQIDANKDYFKQCYNDGLSAYKALLFFNDYLNTKTLE